MHSISNAEKTQSIVQKYRPFTCHCLSGRRESASVYKYLGFIFNNCFSLFPILCRRYRIWCEFVMWCCYLSQETFIYERKPVLSEQNTPSKNVKAVSGCTQQTHEMKHGKPYLLVPSSCLWTLLSSFKMEVISWNIRQKKERKFQLHSHQILSVISNN